MNYCRSEKEAKSEFVFGGDGKTGHLWNHENKYYVLEIQTGIFFSSHCLRRTFATIGESLDISRYSLKRLLNHKINDDADVTAGYVVPNLDRLRKLRKELLSIF